MTYNPKDNKETIKWAKEKYNIGWSFEETLEYLESIGAYGPYYHAFKTVAEQEKKTQKKEKSNKDKLNDAVNNALYMQSQGFVFYEGQYIESKSHKYSKDDGQLFV